MNSGVDAHETLRGGFPECCGYAFGGATIDTSEKASRNVENRATRSGRRCSLVR